MVIREVENKEIFCKPVNLIHGIPDTPVTEEYLDNQQAFFYSRCQYLADYLKSQAQTINVPELPLGENLISKISVRPASECLNIRLSPHLMTYGLTTESLRYIESQLKTMIESYNFGVTGVLLKPEGWTKDLVLVFRLEDLGYQELF